MLHLVNDATAIIAVGMWAAVARGFYPLIDFRDTGATALMVRIVIGAAVLVVVRSLYWDLWRGSDSTVNSAINIVSATIAYFALTLRWQLIGPEERGKWHWWNAWAYPGNCPTVRIVRGKRK